MRKTRKVIIVMDIERTADRGLLRGIVKFARLHARWTLYKHPPYYMKINKKAKLPSTIEAYKADGIIAKVGETKDIKTLIPQGMRAIVIPIGNEIKGFCNILGDSSTSGIMAAEHLLACGFRNFAYFEFPQPPKNKQKLPDYRQVAKSFEKRIADAGFKTHFYESSTHRKRHSWEDEIKLIAGWLKKIPKPVGLHVKIDDLCPYIIEACRKVRLRIPDDVAILGEGNDDMICDLCDPPVSSVALNLEGAGFEAAELLEKMMSGKKVANQTILVMPTHVVTRVSTDIVAVEDSIVADALRFIREHSKEILQVNDVAEAVNVSRRVLENRFRRAINRSVNGEIRRARVEHICRMLLETNQSISNIAYELGYPSSSHIARYFKLVKGISPQTYREQCGSK